MRRTPTLALILGACVLLPACGGGGGAGQAAPPPPPGPQITVQPSDQSVALGQAAVFTVTAAGAGALSYQWQRNAAPISGATASSYTTAPAAAGDSGSSFAVVVTGSGGSATSRSAKLTVTSTPTQGTDVLTYKNDLSRSGQNLNETTLTPLNVAAPSFGLLRNLAVDGKVDAQPLYTSQLVISGVRAQHGVRGHRARLGVCLRRRHGLHAVAGIAARNRRDPERYPRVRPGDA